MSIREIVPHLDEDRMPSPDIQSIYGLIADGTLVKKVEESIGLLKIE